MNPMMLVQAAGAVAGLIGGFIPDKTKVVKDTLNVEGSDLAGRVPGAVGAQSVDSFHEEKYQSGLKKGLLTTSKIAGAVGSIGGALGAAGVKMPNLGGGSSSGAAMTDLSSTLIKANNSFITSKQSIPFTDTNEELPGDSKYKFTAPSSQNEIVPEEGLVIPKKFNFKGI